MAKGKGQEGGGPARAVARAHLHDADALPGWALGRVPSTEAGGLVFYRADG